MFLLAYAWSNLASAVDALAHQSEGEQSSHELHGLAHVSASDHDEAYAEQDSQDSGEQFKHTAHHHCAHNLVGMAFALPPAGHRTDATSLLIANLSNPYTFELSQRLLRPPRD